MPTVIKIFLIFTFAIAAQQIWVNGILINYGWNNTEWGNPVQGTVFIANFFCILSYCLPFWTSKTITRSNEDRIAAFCLLYVMTFAYYFLGLLIIGVISVYPVWVVYCLGILFFYCYVFLPLLILGIIAIGIYRLKHHLGAPNKPKNSRFTFGHYKAPLGKFILGSFFYPLWIVIGIAISIHEVSKRYIGPIASSQRKLLVIGIISCFVLSQIHVLAFPGYGTFYDDGFVDAIKMGYPFFWIILIMGGVGLFTEQNLLKKEEFQSFRPELDDILDEF